MPRSDLSTLVAEAAADVPDRQALVEFGGRPLTWSGLEDEVSRIGPVWVAGASVRASG